MSIDIVIARLQDAKNPNLPGSQRLGIVELALDDLKDVEKSMRRTARADLPSGKAVGQADLPWETSNSSSVMEITAVQGVVETPADRVDYTQDGPFAGYNDEQQRVLAALGDEPRSTAEIAAEAMLPIAKAREVLASLWNDRPGANKAGRGKWVLAPAFEDTVAVLEEKLGHPVPDAVREALEQPDDATEPEPDDPVLSFEERLESALAEAQATA